MKQSRARIKPVVSPEGWSARRSLERAAEKKAIARYFGDHVWLVPKTEKPEKPRETAASVLVVHGTTPDAAVSEGLRAIAARNDRYGPYINWYTSGALVPSTLR